MKKISIIFVLMLAAVTVVAQNPYMDAANNEDEVIHLEQWQQYAACPLQVIVKLQDYSHFTIVNESEKPKVKNETTYGRVPCSAIQSVLDSFIIESVEQLCPTFVMPEQPRHSASYGGGEVRDHDLSQLYLITLNASSPKHEYELIEALAALDEVEYAEPNYLVFALGEEVESGKWKNVADATYVVQNNRNAPSVLNAPIKSSTLTPNDPMYWLQWGIPACGIDSLLTAPKRDTNWRPIIAIIDTGVDIDHPDLAANIWTNTAEQNGANNQDDDGNGFRDDVHGWDFVNQTGQMHDFNSHGTHCAGIAGAVTNNGIGIAGACPDAWIMPVTVMQSDGTGSISTIIQGINYARQNGADVISMSIGTYAYSIAMEQALAVAYQNAVLVAAAGNDGLGMLYCCPFCADMFPGAFTFVLGVQATSQGGGLASFSNYDCTGPSYSAHTEEQLYNYELSAPGVGIMSTVPNGQYRNYNGTSMATPLVAGGVASLLQRREYLTKEILFGDLINYSQEFMPVDFWAAYTADSIAPAMLECVAIEINDTAYGDSSMYADAGERLQLYPTIRTVWGPADSVEIWLEFQEFEDTSTIHILQNHVQLGHYISSYAKAKSVNPIDIQIANNVVDGRHIRLVMYATAPNATDTIRHSFVMEVTNAVKLHGVVTHNDTLWPNVHYVVTGNYAMPEGYRLVIMPGTTVKIKENVTIGARIIAIGTSDSMITFTKTDLGQPWGGILIGQVFQYCIFEWSGATIGSISADNGFFNCIFRNNGLGNPTGYAIVSGYHNMDYSCFYQNMNSCFDYDYTVPLFHCNIINNNRNLNCYRNFYSSPIIRRYPGSGPENGCYNSNVFNLGEGFWYYERANTFYVYYMDSIYHGSNNESIIREHIYDFEYPGSNSLFYFDLSTRATHPSPLAHGIVWKVEVNGFDAQDEFDSIIPLGVGTHEFKVYFNRAMDTSITPMVAMGVRPPYTQTAISENALWSADSTIYTAHLTLTGRSAIDGLNRIYVSGAQDDEHFEIPYENQRFNVYVASSGSMSAGFQATPGIGKVDLEWNDQEVNYEDFLGFNIYRYQYVQQLRNYHYDSDRGQYVYDTVTVPGDTIRLNQMLVQDTMFTDFDVVPGERYYYYYKILSTSLTENSPSKTVSCVPHSTIPGDANGSYAVDVADVITTINYVTGQNPQPFLFDAADVNGDGTINVLDIVNIINIILYPNGRPGTQNITETQTAIYTVVNDTLYIDTPVPLSGLQFTLANCSRSDVEILPALAGFECATVEHDGNLTMVFYSMSGATVPFGRSALLRVESGEWSVGNVALSDAAGNNVVALDGDALGLVDINAVQAQFATAYPNPFSGKTTLEMTVGNYSTAMIVFTDLMGKTVDSRTIATTTAGRHKLIWDATGLSRGIYFATLYVDGMKAQTIKLIVK